MCSSDLASGGSVARAAEPRALAGIFDAIGSELAAQYQVRFVATGSGSRGFTVRAEVAVETFGTERNPWGAEPGDPRVAAGALVLIDPSTGMVLDFFISNDRIQPLYERLPIARDKLGPYPAFSKLLAPLPTARGAWHAYEIRYDRIADTIEWRVDGAVVASRDKAGAPIGRSAPIVKLNTLRVGCGLFTLADPLCDDQASADDHPRIPGFIPDNTQDRFGQGARIAMRRVEIDA